MASIKVTDRGNNIEVVQGSDLTVVVPVESGLEIEQLKFIQLADTPSSYAESEGKTLRVNDSGDGIIFGKTYSKFTSLIDTPTTYENAAGQLVSVNSAGTGLRFINYTRDDVNIEYFTQLADVPNNYTNKAGYILSVDNDESGVEFISKDVIVPAQEHVVPGSYKYPLVVVNEKGIITNIQEGMPFEFEPFEENKLLIGDGTSIPNQLERGNAYQVLQTTPDDTLRPRWVYLDRLIDSYGNPVLVIRNTSNSNAGVLNVVNNSEEIKMYGDLGQGLKLDFPLGITSTGPITSTNGNLTLNNGSVNLDLGSVNITNGNINITTGKITHSGQLGITTGSGIKVKPGSGTVGVTDIDSESYLLQIGNNDFITKAWYDYTRAREKKNNVLNQSEIFEITNNTVVIPIPSGSTLIDIQMLVTSEFNTNAKLRIVDSLNQVLLPADDSPYLTNDGIKILLNQPVANDNNYNITINIEDYGRGQGNIFASYYKEI